MATATAVLTPMSARDTEDTLSQYRDGAAVAGGVVWDLLVHDPAFGPDMARVDALSVPDGLDAEDMHQLLFDLVTEAGELGHRMARFDLAQFDPETVSTADVSRALAALLHRPTVEDDQPFDLEYLRRRADADHAAYLERVNAAKAGQAA